MTSTITTTSTPTIVLPVQTTAFTPPPDCTTTLALELATLRAPDKYHGLLVDTVLDGSVPALVESCHPPSSLQVVEKYRQHTDGSGRDDFFTFRKIYPTYSCKVVILTTPKRASTLQASSPSTHTWVYNANPPGPAPARGNPSATPQRSKLSPSAVQRGTSALASATRRRLELSSSRTLLA